MKKQKEAILTLEEHQNQLLEKAIDRAMMEMARSFSDCDNSIFTLEDVEEWYREQPEIIAQRINLFIEIMD